MESVATHTPAAVHALEVLARHGLAIPFAGIAIGLAWMVVYLISRDAPPMREAPAEFLDRQY
jgi:hypothetical protein